ncbi:YdcF family protein [Oceanihabitans sp. 2_MG-2023]|uniref:YdcF family protein n=1 Tax=Oceanihabitans sp. 2_MG-2023 TaxID=3062661 RepID=UPI0026E127E8|nr:YdcF family protein [Oceanihabitans sp. 2_MG-2023]MDO6597990.1 YdcF family protein [Oceanihabitans sp. 2_MG-2023]
MIITPIKPNLYAYANPNVAFEGNVAINITTENTAVSLAIQNNIEHIKKLKYQMIIVPGFTPRNITEPEGTNKQEIKRLGRAIKAMRKFGVPLIMVSGGNVRPPQTPNNEAYGMKQVLMSKFNLNENQIALDPYARTSVTNMRNCGRFMLKHNLERALIITSFGQNFYFGAQAISTYQSSSKKTLGYKVGKFRFLSLYKTSFIPSQEVFKRSNSPLDP